MLVHLHATGFEPAALLMRTDYESIAFDHSAMHAAAILSAIAPICNRLRAVVWAPISLPILEAPSENQ